MAEKNNYAATLLDAILFAIYFSYTGKSGGPAFHTLTGAAGLLWSANLLLTKLHDGFDVSDSDGVTVARIRYMPVRESTSITVEPASLVISALELLGQSANNHKKNGDIL